MKRLRDHCLNVSALPGQVEMLRARLEETGKEDDLHKALEEAPDFCLSIGRMFMFSAPDQYATEFQLFGDFRADVVIADRRNHAVALIELEDAEENSIFEKGGRAMPEWGRRLEHGCSQIIDWVWKLRDLRQTDAMMDAFGFRPRRVEVALILGRDCFLDETARRRLDWRSEHFLIDSHKVQHWTYDFMIRSVEEWYTSLPARG